MCLCKSSISKPMLVSEPEEVESLDSCSTLVCNFHVWSSSWRSYWSPTQWDVSSGIYSGWTFYLACSFDSSGERASNWPRTGLSRFVQGTYRSNRLYFHRAKVKRNGSSLRSLIDWWWEWLTCFPGELYLKVFFVSEGADFERSCPALRLLRTLPSSWNGLPSKYSLGCIFNLKTPAFSEALWWASSF